MPEPKKNRRFESKQAKYDAARDILAAGVQDVAEDPETLAAYLRFRAHFRGFSMRNTLMIRAQRPGARYCMGFRQWKQHGRRVRKGERGLLIYVPRFRKLNQEEAAEAGLEPGTRAHAGFIIGYVFDIAQTEVIPGEEETALRYVSPVPQLEGDDFADLYDDLKTAAGRFGFQVHEDPNTTTEGYASHRRGLIGIRSDLTTNSKAVTLAHELAHGIAHGPERQKENPQGHEARELQAEGAAFLACYALGLDASKASLPYLKHYERDGEKLEAHLEAIDQIAWKIVEAVENLRKEKAARGVAA